MPDMKNMAKMMSKMGISQEEIDAIRVIIECADKNIVIENPQVVKIKMQGQESWQITGEEKQEEKGISIDDIKTVMEKTGTDEEKSRKALEESKGDLAEAILSLS